MSVSEAKIVIGRYDEYVILPVTVLATLTKLTLQAGKNKKVILSWSKATKSGASVLLVDGKPGTEPIDGMSLMRLTDKHGLSDFVLAKV